MAISTLPFLINMVYSAFAGEKAGDNPWRALTPEWLTSSPPPVENWKGPAPLVTHPYGYGEVPQPQAAGARRNGGTPRGTRGSGAGFGGGIRGGEHRLNQPRLAGTLAGGS